MTVTSKRKDNTRSRMRKDVAFERALTRDLVRMIYAASAAAPAFRIDETISTLATCMSAVLAVAPELETQAWLREAVNEIAQRIERDAARARREGVSGIFGTTRGNA